MKKVLITGGLGYVGSALVDRLLERADTYITILDNGSCGGMRNDVDIILGDIRDRNTIRAILPGYDTIIHLAAIVGEPACIINPAYAESVNVHGTKTLLDYIAPWQHFIYTSSTSVYGSRSGETVKEESYLAPINNYGIHKVKSEELVKLHARKYTILRPATAFGLTRNTRTDLLIHTLVIEALTQGKIVLYEPDVIRPMISVIDYIKIIEQALFDARYINEIYNIGDKNLTTTKKQLVERIAMICNVPIEEKNIISLDPRNYDIDFTKIYNAGYRFNSGALFDTITDIRHNIQALLSEEYNRPYNLQKYLEESRKTNVYNPHNM